MGLLSVLGVFDVPFFDQISLIPSRCYFPEIIPASTLTVSEKLVDLHPKIFVHIFGGTSRKF